MTAGEPSHEVTDDDLYRHSSQYRQWSFTRAEFEAKRLQCHDRGALKFSDPLTVDEETDLVMFYASKVSAITRTFNMPSQVRATAMSYFRKFYLVNSVMEYHPMNILYTSVFLAAKAENVFIPVKKFCAALPRTEPQDILNLEFQLLESLAFTLSVHNGLMPLHGFFLDMQTTLYPSQQGLDPALGQLHDTARAVIIEGFVTDTPFLYTPPQIALAALMTADAGLTTRYLDAKYANDREAFAKILPIITECQTELLNVRTPDSEHGRAVDKKLYRLLHPDKLKKKRSPDGESEGSDAKRLRTQLEDTPGTDSAELSEPAEVNEISEAGESVTASATSSTAPATAQNPSTS